MTEARPPDYADTAFGDPLWILWSSGTTGAPKGIVHSHGGIVLELLKAVGLHCDVSAATGSSSSPRPAG